MPTILAGYGIFTEDSYRLADSKLGKCVRRDGNDASYTVNGEKLCNHHAAIEWKKD